MDWDNFAEVYNVEAVLNLAFVKKAKYPQPGIERRHPHCRTQRNIRRSIARLRKLRLLLYTRLAYSSVERALCSKHPHPLDNKETESRSESRILKR